MLLSPEQITQYDSDGFLLVENVFSPDEVDSFCQAFKRDSEIPGAHLIQEEGGYGVRGIYGSHMRQPEFAALTCDARILGPVKQLSAEGVYVYQFKINAKPAFGGESWSWHQDYIAWKICDNLPAPPQVNVGLFLDEFNEFNGPVIFVPGSHRYGLVRDSRKGGDGKSSQHLDPEDIALTAEQMASLVREHGMVSPKGPAGSLVFFDSQVVHGSAQNISPFPRKLLIITYNAVSNLPSWTGEPRPAYVVCRDTTPLEVEAAA